MPRHRSARVARKPARSRGGPAPRAARAEGAPRAATVVLILSAFPRKAAAERAARSLVTERILACATVTVSSRAYYRWNGRVVTGTSALLWGKTTKAMAKTAIQRIRESHPDRVPEILVLPVSGGDPGYLRWLGESVTKH